METEYSCKRVKTLYLLLIARNARQTLYNPVLFCHNLIEIAPGKTRKQTAAMNQKTSALTDTKRLNLENIRSVPYTGSNIAF
jgi:hypothetical protein